MAGLTGAGPRETQTAALSPEKFHCLLEELPLHLIPRHSRDRCSPDANERRLFLNPECMLTSGGRIPAELKSNLDSLRDFELQETIAWVRAPETRALYPFWLGPCLQQFCAQMRPGEPAPESLDSRSGSLLNAAGILIGEAYLDRRRSMWSVIVKKRAALFRGRNYAPISDLIHPFHIAALRRYYRQRIRRGTICLGDQQSSRRYALHNENVARFFHVQLTKAIGDIVGEPVKPSYVYLASYLPGAELKKHVDREQCEFSVTLCLDFSPEPELATSWPICVDTPEGQTRVYQALGDGLVYRGTRVPHYRTALADGYMSTSIFFHYVPERFSGTLD